MQSDGNSWKIDAFREITYDHIFILKTPTRPYSCQAKGIICLELVYNMWFISSRLMKSVSFQTDPN